MKTLFERVFPTEAQRDAEAAEGRSAGQIAGLRLAALVLMVNVLVSIALPIVFHLPVPVIQIVIAIGLAYYLYKLRPRAEALALGLALLGAVLQPVALFLNLPPFTALMEALPIWGITGALLLLLTGDPTRARRVAALALFCILTLGLYALAVIGRLGS